MSNIDQAFINAYSDQPAVVQTPPPRPAFAPRTPAPAPKLRVFDSHHERESEVRFEQAEPVVASRPPHFVTQSTAQSVDPYAPIANQQYAGYSSIANKSSQDTGEELLLPSLVSDRRPLSSFSTPRPAPSAAFKPVFEVDEFRWPAITDDLLRTSQSLLSPVVNLLLSIAQEGRTLVGIAGTNNGVGTSTVAMCLARTIAQAGHGIALVDGNFSRGNLASTLGLEFDSGWEDVLAGQIPLAECAVASLADHITLIPLGGPALSESQRLSSIQSSVIAGMLRYHHELVLFDLGAASDSAQVVALSSIVEHCRLDAGIIVAPSDARDPVTVHGSEQLNKVFGPLCLGVIGNRAS
jgi:Mrp family chromosome partitioning ATPase